MKTSPKQLNRSKRKLQIRTQIESLGSTFNIQNLERLISWLDNKRKELVSQGYSDIELTYEFSGYDNPHEMFLVGIREETDKEYNKRMSLVELEKKKETERKAEHFEQIKSEAKKLGIIK